MTRSSDESPEAWFHRLATDYVEAQILFHLNRVGVFEELDRRGPLQAEALASALGLVAQPLAVLLDYVCGVDRLVERDGDGAYGMSAWGRQVLDRYGREDGDGRSFNFFDVRVGAYGPVWSALGSMLRGEVSYGDGVERAGDRAADAVYKVGAQLAKPLARIVDGLGARTLVEIGVTSGLLSRLALRNPGVSLVGLDRSPAELAEAQSRAMTDGVDAITWIEADLFRPDTWTAQLAGGGPGCLFTVHAHEFLAAGEERVVNLLQALGQELPGWTLVAMEQPMLADSERGQVSDTLWRYHHSNVLIHHLIGNGRILGDEAWRALFARAGCGLLGVEPLNYLGYHAYTLRL